MTKLELNIQNSSPNDHELHALATIFLQDPENIYQDHISLWKKYEGTDHNAWARFLTHIDVVEYIDQQIHIVSQQKLNKLKASDKNSYAQSQQMVALHKMKKEDQEDDDRVKFIIMSPTLYAQYQDKEK